MYQIHSRPTDVRAPLERRLRALWSLSLSPLSGDSILNFRTAQTRPALAAILGAIARHEVDAIVVRSLHHLGTSVESLLDTLAELHRHGVKLVVHDHADAVETGGLLAAADLLVEARRHIDATREHRGRSVEGQDERCSVRAPARAFRLSGEGASETGCTKRRHQCRQGIPDQGRDGGCWADCLIWSSFVR